jgi:hypothetical protein
MMLQTVEAVIECDGRVRLLEAMTLPESRRALVTVLPDVVGTAEDLSAAYAAMAADESREAEALEWANALISDVADEAR